MIEYNVLIKARVCKASNEVLEDSTHTRVQLDFIFEYFYSQYSYLYAQYTDSQYSYSYSYSEI